MSALSRCSSQWGVVQVLTHVKEKLQFAQKEKEALQVELDSVEAALATHRDELSRVKLTRDKAIVATRKLRDAGSCVTNAALLADLEVGCCPPHHAASIRQKVCGSWKLHLLTMKWAVLCTRSPHSAGLQINMGCIFWCGYSYF